MAERKPLSRAEARRVRRGRQPGSQQGQGHGERTYVPVRGNVWLLDPEARERRKRMLRERYQDEQNYLSGLRAKVRKQQEEAA